MSGPDCVTGGAILAGLLTAVSIGLAFSVFLSPPVRVIVGLGALLAAALVSLT